MNIHLTQVEMAWLIGVWLQKVHDGKERLTVLLYLGSLMPMMGILYSKLM
jgi:hypothetical protein